MARLQNFGFTPGSGKQFPLADTYFLFSSSQTFSYSQTFLHTQVPFSAYGRYNSSFLQLLLVFTQHHFHFILPKRPQTMKDGYTTRLLCSNAVSSCLKNNSYIKAEISEESHAFVYNTGNSVCSPKSIPQVTETPNSNYMAFSGWSKASLPCKTAQ